jgi:eukaryotic-like serine/threonine-protein kinase
MADGRSSSRGAVPIALGSGASGTEEGREFYQSRVALFGGWVGLISGSFYAAYWILVLWIAPDVELPVVPVGDPTLYHLGATFVGGALWGVARWSGPLPMRVLGWLEAIATFAMCTCFAMMGIGFAQGHVAIEQDPMHGLLAGLSACSYVLLSRAVAVPSTPARTIAVSSVAMLPMATLGPYAVAGARMLSIDVPALIDISIWCLAAVAMSVVASRVIFGLRAEVDKVKRLGQYTLESKLGEGGMGVVYRARHAMLRRPTAIKILRPEIAGEDTLKRFEREVLLTASLSHPSTVAVFDYGRTPQGLFYYAMEYLDGLNLEQLVRADGPQPPARVAHIMRQVCGALAEAHGVGLIHRDVKPANIILSERGGMPDVAKVVDFGLVKSFEEASSRGDLEVTSANLIVGTPLYMAPEAIGGGAALDGRSDLYALGAVGYFLLTGAPVFSATTHVEIFAHHLHTLPEPPSVRTGNYVPDELERIILKCLAKRPGDRYDNAKALGHALDDCAERWPWDSDLALQWWAGFRSGQRDGSAAAPVTTSAQATIVVDITKRVAQR